MKKLLLVALLVSSLNIIAGDDSDSHEKRGFRGKGHMMKLMKELNLSDEQKEQMKALRGDSKNNRKEKRKEIKELKAKLDSLFITDAKDSELIAIHKKIMAIKAEQGESRFEGLLKKRAILTVEQRKKFIELKPKHRRGGFKGRDRGED